MKRLFATVIYILIFNGCYVSAQGYLSLGYQSGFYTSGLPNFQNIVYQYNHSIYSGFTDKFEYSPFHNGLAFEFGIKTSKSTYIFTAWNNKHFITHGEGTYHEGSYLREGDIDIKVRHNNFQVFGMGYFVKPWLGIGASPFDVGAFKVLIRDKKNIDSKKQDWNQVHEGNTGLFSQNTTLGCTLFADFFPLKRLRIRTAYYFAYFQPDLGIDPYYSYRVNSLQLQASLILGRK